MARIRSIHPNACKSEKLDASSAEAERCYWRLLPHCDDEGRCEDDPRILRSLLFQVSETITAGDVEGWLDDLDKVGLIVRYDAEGQRCIAVTKWDDFQHPQKRSKSTLPNPSGSGRVEVREDYLPGVGEGYPGEGVGEGEGDAHARRAPYESDFDAWWAEWPKKVDRGRSFHAYSARRRGGATADELTTARDRYITAHAGTDRQYIKNGATFLAKDTWVEWRDSTPEGAQANGARPADPTDDAPGAHHCDACGELDFLPGTGHMACGCSR